MQLSPHLLYWQRLRIETSEGKEGWWTVAPKAWWSGQGEWHEAGQVAGRMEGQALGQALAMFWGLVVQCVARVRCSE